MLYVHADDVVRLTLNRPKAKNAVSFGLWEAFAAALDRMERETPPRAVVLSGACDFFCAGGDLKTPPRHGSGALSEAARLELGQRILTRLRALPALTIAAVEGRAIGIGWSLALACDVLVAAEDAMFSAPFARLGFVPDGGISWFLTERIGRHRAAEILFSGRTMLAPEAHTLGLASLLARPGNAVQTALAFAAEAGAGNRHALELTKRLLHRAEEGSLADVHALEIAYAHITQTGEEAKAVRAAGGK